LPYYTTPDSCRIFYTAYGIDTSKQIVIFLNGTTQTTLYWGNHVPVFSKRYGLLFYDARGQGQSNLGTRPISLEQHVSDLKHLLEHLAVDKAHLVGISHGARLITVDFDKPTLVLSGSEDPLVEPQDVRQLTHRCRADHHQLAGIGHSIPAEAPEIFQQLVLEFLQDRKF
jgi:pimeloyl-ACP methyl ester carboxylesterase